MDLNRWSEIQQRAPNPSTSTHPYAHFYNAPLSTYANGSYYPSHQIQNPNTLQIPSTQFDASLQPPGTDSYVAVSSYHPPHVGYEAQATVAYGHQSAQQVGEMLEATNYQVPSIAQNWGANEGIQYCGADPNSYAAAIKSLNKKTVVPTSLANDVMKRTPQKPKIMQTMRCEVCKIDCNSKDVYDRHILGKKHKGNLLKQEQLSKDSVAPACAPMSKIPRTAMKRSLSGELEMPKDWQTNMGPSLLAAGEDLETKTRKLLEVGTAVDSVMVCTICNIVCNSQIVFNYHIRGKKHAAQGYWQAGTRPANVMEPLVPANPNPTFWTNPVVRPPLNSVRRWGPKKTKIVQSAWCETCKIDCTSKDVLDQHKLGKKHKKNLEKLEESKKAANASAPTAAQIATNTIIGPQENPSGDKGKKKPASSAPVEDLETKRRKLMESGAVAEEVRICAICNVACNSPTVFSYHLSGQKHATMVKKQMAAGGVTNLGPQVVTAS